METQIRTSSLRQSCVFCRGRKIRCTGGRICGACRDRNINCIYAPEARKGRPKRKGVEDQRTPNSGNSKRDKKQHTTSVNASLAGGRGDDSVNNHAPAALTKIHTLGTDLEQMFDDYFISKIGSESNLLQESITLFQRRHQQPFAETHPSHPTHHRLNYDGLLSAIAQEMLEMLLLRVDSLRCGQPDEANRNFFLASLAADTTLSMFNHPHNPNPLEDLGKHRILQLIDLWYSGHPLSPLVSKTLLIGDVKDETVDKALLAIILADACHVQGGSIEQDGTINDESQRLFEFAAAQLKQRRLPLSDTATLSTLQALFLMAWRELCLGHARRATCIVGYSCYMASRLGKTWKINTGMDSVKLNGVEIGMVKKEILRNVHWLCLSTTSWAFMQFGHALTLFGPDEISDFPCLDETTSALIRLDQASDNISTLPAQIQALRCLWPLSHISTTVAHIYILYLNTPAKAVPRGPWQEQHIHQLHNLLQSCVDLPTLSSKIRDVLLQAVQVAENRNTTSPSQLYLLVGYHIIIIHMLFSKNGMDPNPSNISSTVIHAFCQSAAALLALSQRSISLAKGLIPVQREGGIEFTGMLVLGLDTCSRALVRIYDHLNRGSIDSQKMIAAKRKQLAGYADKFHHVCKGDAVMRCGSVIRPIKKRLKWAKLAFQHLQAPPESQSVFTPIQDRFIGIPVSSIAQDFLVDPTSIAKPTHMSSLSGSMPCEVETTDPFILADDPVIGSLLGFHEFTNVHEQPSRDCADTEVSKQNTETERDLFHMPGSISLLLDSNLSGERLDLVHDSQVGLPFRSVSTNNLLNELSYTSSDMTESASTNAIGFKPPELKFDTDLWAQLANNPDDKTGPLYAS
ncbi:hypothetical protein ETB97_001482 [Aspergillus alliaceus]|uniref:Zn(2)-C6 fungal-type domain-containing protein n=1 Tax=Petromyces alliaceus TaxID=209559 RepID=A0A8H6A444_PETAA|nr:hypothetical protein ETB97_001482 [Aspergillus burnettii]